MTENEKITYVTTMVEETDSAVLSTYLTIAGQAVINAAYPYDDTVTEVPVRYHPLQCEIAAYLINKRGADYQEGHSENGISRTYGSNYIPKSMLASVTPHCGVFRSEVTADENP